MTFSDKAWGRLGLISLITLLLGALVWLYGIMNFGFGDASSGQYIELALSGGLVMMFLGGTGVVVFSGRWISSYVFSKGGSHAAKIALICIVLVAALIAYGWLVDRLLVDSAIEGRDRQMEFLLNISFSNDLDLYLWHAARWGNRPSVALLISEGADVNAHLFGASVLNASLHNLGRLPDGNYAVVELLLENGANADEIDKQELEAGIRPKIKKLIERHQQQ